MSVTHTKKKTPSHNQTVNILNACMFLQVSSFSIKQILLSIPLSLSHRWPCQICWTLPRALIFCSLWFHISSSAASVTPWRAKSNRTRWECHSSRSRTLVNICTVCRFLSYSSVSRRGKRGKLLSKITRQIASDDSACGGWRPRQTEADLRGYSREAGHQDERVDGSKYRQWGLVRLMKSNKNMWDKSYFCLGWLYAYK